MLILVELFSKDDAKIIISTDRDFFQLVDERTAIFRPVKTKENPKGELIDLDWMMQKEDVFPPNYALLKAIVGDKSDNIKGGLKAWGEPTVKDRFSTIK